MIDHGWPAASPSSRGPTHGIGAATAKALAAEGAGVFITSYRRPPCLERGEWTKPAVRHRRAETLRGQQAAAARASRRRHRWPRAAGPPVSKPTSPTRRHPPLFDACEGRLGPAISSSTITPTGAETFDPARVTRRGLRHAPDGRRYHGRPLRRQRAGTALMMAEFAKRYLGAARHGAGSSTSARTRPTPTPGR